MEDIKKLSELIKELKTTNSTNDKIKILKKYPECKKILRWALDPFKQYYITSDNLRKNPHFHTIYKDTYSTFNSIYDLLHALDSRAITGHQALASIWYFLDKNKSYLDTIIRVLDRNLKVRLDAKLINKVWPGTVPSFDVALANKYDDVKGRVDFTKDTWFASRKLDGVRVITIIDNNGDVKFFSRKGKEFETLGKVQEQLKKTFLCKKIEADEGFVLDGEMCIVDENGNENFADIIKLIRRKDFTIPNPRFKVFDMMLLSVFEGTNYPSENATFSQRQEAFKHWGDKLFNNDILDLVEQRRIKSDKDLEDFVAEANEKHWEGLILRKDVPYEGKRSNNMLKVKKFHDAEFIVQDVEMGPIRIIKDGLEVTETMLSAIKIPYKGNTVSVGSGFSIEQRQEFYKNPKKILGKTVTIQYFEETLNEQGLYSLRFPVLKHIYDSGRDI